MLWSKSFIPTLREAPQEAESAGHKFMLKSGFAQMLVAGVYSYLPLGLKALRNIENIIRQEMNATGAEELLLPGLQPQELWDRSGRNKQMEEIMFRFTDRRGRNMCLGPTHEEVITDLVARSVNSYRQLPLTLYQIQTKFRDEIRPRFGMIRACEFIMKDAYSFDVDENGLDKNYKLMYDAYIKIFRRCGLDCVITEADPGVMGGNVSHEFMVMAESGEDTVSICPQCNFASTLPKDACPKCKTPLDKHRAIELGHIFKLGLKYSQSLQALFANEKGERKPVVMGCYGIGVSRLFQAIIEAHHDEKGIIWPREVSPFEVLISPLNVTESAVKNSALDLYQKLKEKGLRVLLDDRNESPGVKFNDADLIGVPLRVIIGPKALARNEVELQARAQKSIQAVKIDEAVDRIAKSI